MGRTRSDIEPRILDAARSRFLREGVDGASLRAIAADAGTSIGMVYYYFKTKDELFLAVVEATYVKLLDELTHALDPALPPRERIRALYRRIGQITQHEAEVVRLVIREVLVSSARLKRVLARFQRGHFPLVMQAIFDGTRDGSIRSDVSPLLLLPVIAGVGVIPQFALARLAPGMKLPELPDMLVELLYGGISSPGKSPTRTRSRARRKGTRGS
jgi:AcrR family transcriptional regulator